MRQLPHLQELWEEHRDDGLHIFHAESQHFTREKVERFLKRYGVTFPNPLLDDCSIPVGGGASYGGWAYDHHKLPKTYIIGVEGFVIWEGVFGYDEVLEEELKKVRYPGLFRLTVAPEVRKAAQAFAKRRYAEAEKLARKVLERHQDGDAFDDASHVIKRVHDDHAWLTAKADDALADQRYPDALDALDELTSLFARDTRGDEAKKRAKELRRDRDVQAEIAAFEALEKCYTAKTDDALTKKLEAFLRKHGERRAARDAQRMLDAMAEETALKDGR